MNAITSIVKATQEGFVAWREDGSVHRAENGRGHTMEWDGRTLRIDGGAALVVHDPALGMAVRESEAESEAGLPHGYTNALLHALLLDGTWTCRWIGAGPVYRRRALGCKVAVSVDDDTEAVRFAVVAESGARIFFERPCDGLAAKVAMEAACLSVCDDDEFIDEDIDEDGTPEPRQPIDFERLLASIAQ